MDWASDQIHPGLVRVHAFEVAHDPRAGLEFDHGHHVGRLEAQGGQESVKIYKENKDKIDMIILDMIMPEMSGKKVYDKIKEINPNIKILLSSGYSRMDKAAEILKGGCDDFIQKPFSLKELSSKLAEILTQN